MPAGWKYQKMKAYFAVIQVVVDPRC